MSWRIPRRASGSRGRGRDGLGAGQASALTLAPPKPNVFFGVSDRGTTHGVQRIHRTARRKHPALLETFHPWGNSLNPAYERWRETSTRPILHISTADDQTLAELITPAADRPRRWRRLPAPAQRLLRQTRPARLHQAAGRAQPLPQRLVGGQLRRQPERRRTHDRLVQAGLPPNRHDRARRPTSKGSTRPSPKSACRRSTAPKGRPRPACRRRR